MPFDWSEFLIVAEDLARSSRDGAATPEAYVRSAVGRAYYGVFGLARQTAHDIDGIQLQESGAAHRGLIRHYGLSRERARSDLSAILDRMRKLRNECDYHAEVEDLEARSAAALMDTDVARQHLATLRSE